MKIKTIIPRLRQCNMLKQNNRQCRKIALANKTKVIYTNKLIIKVCL